MWNEILPKHYFKKMGLQLLFEFTELTDHRLEGRGFERVGATKYKGSVAFFSF